MILKKGYAPITKGDIRRIIEEEKARLEIGFARLQEMDEKSGQLQYQTAGEFARWVRLQTYDIRNFIEYAYKCLELDDVPEDVAHE